MWIRATRIKKVKTNFWGKKILNFLDVDPNPGSFWSGIPDLGWKNSNPGSGIWYKHPGSAKLLGHFGFGISAFFCHCTLLASDSLQFRQWLVV
jgi:hypothetical protein